MRTRNALLIAVLTALGTGLVAVGPTAAAGVPGGSGTAASARVAASTTIIGNGFGHGRGMSQHGAQAAAGAGLSAEEIVAFYYPGTTAGRFAGRVRVLIGKDNDNNLIVRPSPGLMLRDLRDGARYPLPVGVAKRWRLGLLGGKVRVAYFAADGIWRPYRPGGKETLLGGGEFRSTNNVHRVLIRGVDHRYRGWMRFTTRRTVNVVGIDGYLRGVVPGEMPASWRAEALQAQAIAARTYAAFERAEKENQTYQLFDDTRSQVYRGFDGEVASTNEAVVATAGQIRLADGRPAFTQFSASNGGWSVDGGRSYLTAQADPYDEAYRSWSTPLNSAALERARPGIGTLQSITILRRDGNGEWGGRVLTLRLNGSKGTATLAGTDFRTILGLRSNWFRLT